MRTLLFFSILIFYSCDLKRPFNFSSDYRTFPIAVDCEKASLVNLTFSKIGMPTKKFNENNVTFKILKNDKGEDRPICILDDLSLLELCQYRGVEEVAPYWVNAYQKINTVKCSEVLK